MVCKDLRHRPLLAFTGISAITLQACDVAVPGQAANDTITDSGIIQDGYGGGPDGVVGIHAAELGGLRDDTHQTANGVVPQRCVVVPRAILRNGALWTLVKPDACWVQF